MSGISIRIAKSKEIEFAYSVKKAAFKEYVDLVWGWDEDEQRKLHETRFASQDFRIITVDGIDIGIIAVAISSDCMKLNQLFLLPEYQNRGIGQHCMELIMLEAKKLGLPIRLRVLKVNTKALAFYQRLGFNLSGEIDTHRLLEWTS